jgi:SAM-dependent methyltransferase
VLLGESFGRVIATDAGAQQVASAEPHPRVEYRVAVAEASGLADHSVDLITAAQAAHWFDLTAFSAEARRVGRPGGLLALITYGVSEIDPDIDPVVQHFYEDVVGPYRPPERRHVEDGYRSFDFPFEEITAPPLAVVVNRRAADLIGYADTWSAVRGPRRRWDATRSRPSRRTSWPHGEILSSAAPFGSPCRFASAGSSAPCGQVDPAFGTKRCAKSLEADPLK